MNIKTCHLCHANDIYVFYNFSSLYQVTSDCKPWHLGGELILCKHCQTVQKTSNENFQADINTIYQKYDIYHQSKGNEQRGFDQLTGVSSGRTQLIVKWLLNHKLLADSGYMLDIGCGSGNLLDSFSSAYPQWQVSGFEINDKHRLAIENKYQENSFYSGSLDTIERKFNLIALIHTLEHISSPAEVLNRIYNKLVNKGRLLIAVPNFTKNPFDLLIADHCTHFTQDTLIKLLHENGFMVINQLKDELTKEVILIAEKTSSNNCISKAVTSEALTGIVNKQIEWLIKITKQTHILGKKEKFGVFGTAIAANWLLGFESEQIAFFLDEDPNRINTQLENKPVYHPSDHAFDHNIPILLPFAPSTAKEIAQRLKLHHINCVLPPDIL